MKRHPSADAGHPPTPRGRARARRWTGLLALLALAQLAPVVGPAARHRTRRTAATETRTIVNVGDLDQARRYGAYVDAHRSQYATLAGTLTGPDRETSADVTAFLEDGALRLIEERVRHGDDGSTSHNRYYVHDGRLVYYESVAVRVRPVGDGVAPARDEIHVELAYADDGHRIGGAKVVNGESVPVAPADEAAAIRRAAALGTRVAAALEEGQG